MSEKKEKSTKAKVKEFAYKAVSKVGHGLRKAGPYILTIIVTTIGVKALGKDDNDSTNA